MAVLPKRREFNNLSSVDTANHILGLIKNEIMLRPWARNSKKLGHKREGLFEIEPVSSKDFFSKDGFYPEPCYPLQQRLLDAIFGTNPLELSTDKNRFVVLWGMSAGKDQTIAKAFAYAAYWLCCLYEPQLYFPGLGKGTTIDLVNFCITGYLAKAVFFKALKNIVMNVNFPGTSRNFFQSLGMDMREGHDVQTRFMQFPKNIRAHSLDSQSRSAVGMNVLISVYDEVGGFTYRDAQSCFDTTTKTSVSRFKKYHKAILISWPRDYNDFMMTKYREALTDGDESSKVWVDKHATWEVNLGTKREDFAEEFVRNPESAKRVYKCEVDVGEHSYFKYPELIRFNINHKRFNPVVGDKYRTFNIRRLRFKDWFRGIDGVRYFGHIDLAKGKEGGDCAGICLCHNVSGMPVKHSDYYLSQLQKLIGENAASYFRKEKFGNGIFVDLMIQLRAEPGREIIFKDIISLFQFLQEKRNFEIHKITYDGYSSVGEIQRMKDIGIDSGVLSVDRDTEAYDTLKTLIYGGLIDYYKHPIAVRELEELILAYPQKNTDSPSDSFRRLKINHPVSSIRRYKVEGLKSGSKDVSDALAGACKLAMENIGTFSAWWGDMVSVINDIFSRETGRDFGREERAIREAMTERAKANYERIKAQDNAPLVRRGDPVGNTEYY